MNFLLKVSRGIDALNRRVGAALIWLVLIVAAVSAFNAVVRKLFNLSSNALLDIQWYLFATLFLLGAGYTLLHQGHVKVDVLFTRFSKRTQTWIEIFGLLCFLLPYVYVVISGTWPSLVNAYDIGENSTGKLRLWPVYAMIPLGFALLGLQALSELIKRVGFLLGRCADPAASHSPEKSA